MLWCALVCCAVVCCGVLCCAVLCSGEQLLEEYKGRATSSCIVPAFTSAEFGPGLPLSARSSPDRKPSGSLTLVMGQALVALHKAKLKPTPQPNEHKVCGGVLCASPLSAFAYTHSLFALCCVVLCCAVAVLCCGVLCCGVLCCVVLCCVVLCCVVLCCAVLCCCGCGLWLCCNTSHSLRLSK